MEKTRVGRFPQCLVEQFDRLGVFIELPKLSGLLQYSVNTHLILASYPDDWQYFVFSGFLACSRYPIILLWLARISSNRVANHERHNQRFPR